MKKGLSANLFITQYDMDPHYMVGSADPTTWLEVLKTEKIMGIYGDLWGFMGIYITKGPPINPHKSQPGFIKNQYT